MGNILAILFVCLFTIAAFAGPCDFGGPGSGQPVNMVDRELPKKVESLFSVSCKSCHGLGATGGASAMTDIMNRDLIVREGMISLTDPPSSRIIKALNRPTRWMPLGGSRMADSDIQAILSWIELGAPDWKQAPPTTDPILTHAQEVECIAHDQSKLSTKDAYYVRYMTLGHLKGKEFSVARDGVIKLINSLTFANSPKAPRKVDSLGKILAIDFRDYEPTLNAAVWEKHIVPGYPYAYVSEDDKLFNFYVEKINKYAYSERAFVRGDWFIDQTGQSPVYEKLMLPSRNLTDLERVLGIDSEKDLLSAYAKRGSVAKSGVTNYPRLVDKFDFDFIGAGSAEGYHWITRDFNGDKGTRNIYAFPFGPRILNFYKGWDEAKLFAAKVFENDAGESITQLPNGFQFYGVWDAKNNFVAEANPHIAVDRSGLYEDSVVRNPMSCFRCHAGGINPFEDDSVIRHVKQSPSFTVNEVKFAEDLFFTADQRHAAFDKHAATFKKAMETIGLTDPKYLTPGGEPISQAYIKFDGYMTCTDLAWELGLTYDALVKYLHHSPDLARKLGLADCETGKLSRDNYEHHFGEILKEFDLGFQVKVGGGHVVVDKCKYVLSNKSGRTVKFKVQFGSDAAQQVQFNNGESKAFEFEAKQDGKVSDVWFWSGNSWWTHYLKANVSECRGYQFLWHNNQVGLFRE